MALEGNFNTIKHVGILILFFSTTFMENAVLHPDKEGEKD